MSRCFPYPPPGYERDLVAKEKHKEKSKKEKRDKEKKDKDKSKDKHKEKKDRKDRHKDKKRDKSKDKDKNKTSDARRIEERTDNHNERRADVSIPKSEKDADSRFTKELGRRIRDEQEGAAKKMLENNNGQIQGGAHGFVAAPMQEAERSTGNTVAAKFISKELRRVDDEASAAKRVRENIDSQIQGIQSLDAASHNAMVAKFLSKEQRRVDGVGIVPAVATVLQKERDNGNQIVTNVISKEQRKGDAILGQTFDNGNRLHVQKDATRSTMENGKAKYTKSDDRKGDRQGLGYQVVKKSKLNDGETKIDDGKGNRHRVRDHEKTSEVSKSIGDEEKEKEEKKRRRGEHSHKLHNRLTPNGEIAQPDNPQNYNECFSGDDVHNKKRKHIEENGFLHDNAVRHSKATKAAFSSQPPLVNGVKSELSQTHLTPNNVTKADNNINNKLHKISDFVQAQPQAMVTGKKLVVPKAPHPDSKYLAQVYSVPDMEEWPELDDQQWLFSISGREPKSEAGEPPPEVWASGLHIASADIFALPYVLPY